MYSTLTIWAGISGCSLVVLAVVVPPLLWATAAIRAALCSCQPVVFPFCNLRWLNTFVAGSFISTPWMKKLFYLFIFTIWTLPTLGQELISNGGGYHTNANGSLTFSIGEPIINTFSAGNYTLTQGFNQTRLTITAIDQTEFGLSDIKAWPNPTNQFMILEQNQSNASHALLYDASGKQVRDFSLSGPTNTLDVSIYANGAYTLRVLDKHNKNLKSFRVVIVK